MKLFYQPKQGDRVIMKKEKLTGTVIKSGIKCVVKMDDTQDNLILDYYKLRPLHPGAVNRRIILSKINQIKNKLSDLF